MQKDLNTEQKIKKAAKAVFIQKGLSGARMQEIADAAGINKALLHYYYRSKDKLFQTVFDEVVKEFIPRVLDILGSDLPLEQKITAFIDNYLKTLLDNPLVPLFVISELRRRPHEIIDIVGVKRSDSLKNLDQQLKQEVAKGNIKPISIEHFMVNLISMSVFPFIAQPMVQGVFDMDDQRFRQFIEERKKVVPQFILSAISRQK